MGLPVYDIQAVWLQEQTTAGVIPLTLTVEQQEHIQSLAKAWIQCMKMKYKNGVREHGGNLWDRSDDYLLDQALMENIDQFVYLYTLKQNRLRRVKMKKESILDKYRLHPFGGYSNDPTLSKRIEEVQERWKNLTPEELKQAKEEFEEKYPSVDDHASGGR